MTPSALAHVADLGVRLPAAALRWWVAPLPALPTTRDEALQTAVAVGGALLLMYAGWAHAAHRATHTQVRAVAAAGVGFLLSAYAAAALRAHGVVGPAVSMVGVVLVFRASLALVRERHEAHAADEAKRDAARRGGPPLA